MEPLHIQLLGHLNITYGETPVIVKSARLQSLLAYLLLHRAHPQSRQQIAFTFWSDLSERQARNNLRQVVFDLRRVLPHAECFVEIGDTTLQWLEHAPFTLDVLEFERELANAANQKSSARRACLERAVGIYQGDLLATCYDDWILPERERLQQCFVRAMEEWIELLKERREYRLAFEQAQRLLRYDPLREETYCELMRLASRCGDRTGVIRYYRACVNTLQRELECDPSPETRCVYEQALSDLAAHPQDEWTPLPSKIYLPLQPNCFIGRTQELAQLKRLVAEQRLVTLTGPAGVGKTRLAVAVASELNLPQGVWFVNLRPATDSAGVAQAVASALGIREAGTQRLQDALTQYLQTKHLLLVMDNCEHLLADIRVLVERWLRLAPGLRILATSREALGISNEVVYRVPPLDVPEMQVGASEKRAFAKDELSAIARSDSVRLFCDRANSVLPTFELSAETAPFVAGICRRLDGLPLAIELAAARMNVLSAEQIYRRLDAALGLLTRGGSIALPHQETLQATLDWGHSLLSASERALFRRLAVFAGSFHLEAIEAICDIPSASVLDLLSNLVDKSLVQPAPTANVMRYRLLEVVRQFACAKLRDAEEEQVLRQRHRDYYVQWAEHGEPELRGARQLDWFAQFEREHDNLRAALEFCQQAGDAENGLRLASALWWFWRARLFERRTRARRSDAHSAQCVGQPKRPRTRVEHGGVPRTVSGRFSGGTSARAGGACYRPKDGGQASDSNGALHSGG